MTFDSAGRHLKDEPQRVLPYAFSLQLLKPINVSKSTCFVRARDVSCVLEKAVEERHWPRSRAARKPCHALHLTPLTRLLLSETKPALLSTDWSSWIDEEKDGVRWNDLADRPWEWWKHEGEEEEEEGEDEHA